MRTKDELFREALRHIAARRQQAVTAAEADPDAGRRPRRGPDRRGRSAESGRRALDSCLCHAGPWAGGFCSALHLPHLQGYRHGERPSLQLRGRSSPHPAAG